MGKFYRSWENFAKHRPVLWVLYENMKADPVSELRRIVDFLGFKDVTDERLHCAVDASSLTRLQKADDRLVHGLQRHAGENFFGSRSSTESREHLHFPQELIAYFTSIGMFNITRALGYEGTENAEL